MSIRVVLADDQPLVRSGLRLLIDQAPDLEVVGEAASGSEAVRLARELQPDVVVMDIRMPDVDGIEATRTITAESKATRVVMLTTFDDDESIYGSLRAGASGFLVKDMAVEEILAAVRVVAAGDGLIAPSVTRRLIEQFAGRTQAASHPAPLEDITEREREVLTRVARGLSNREIASELYISLPTVKAHIAHLLLKLEARDRVQLVIIAYDAGLVRPSG